MHQSEAPMFQLTADVVLDPSDQNTACDQAKARISTA